MSADPTIDSVHTSPTQAFQEAVRTLLQEYDVSLTFRNGVWIFRSADLFVTCTIEELAMYLKGPQS